MKYTNIQDKISIKTKSNKLSIIIILILVLIILIFNSLLSTINTKRKLPALYSSKKELAIRGDIKSADNFKISTSKKLYKATIDIRCLDINKKELFITLFSIYSSINKNIIKNKINKALKKKRKKKTNLTLSYNINSKTAKDLKILSYKLRRLNVFKAIKIYGSKIIIGLDIVESGEKRIFPYKDTLSPVIGYLEKYESSTLKTKVKGMDGLEKQYNKELNNTQDGILKGERDVLSKISFNKNSTITKRKDGDTIYLNIPLKLQKNIETVLDYYKSKLKAKEIIASIMESSTGKIITLASSNRYNPEDVKQSQINKGYLSINAVEMPFEPGSVIKPISLALVLEHNKYKKDELIYAHNYGKTNKDGKYPEGKYKIDKWTIHDDHKFKKRWLTLDDIFIYSSNIGTLTLAQRLKGKEFYNGFKSFGLSKKTGIDLPYERKGMIHTLKQYKAYDHIMKKKVNVYKATDSYGHGITATFMQVLKAYSTFNNDGKIVTPRITNNIEINKNNISILQQKPIQIIKKSTANEIKRLLIKTVQKGTGTAAKIDNIEVGGKTGTANISKGKAGYSQSKYISSFFGFANGEKNKYTIGVTVIEPISKGKHWYYHYASHSAVPVFKKIVNTLVGLNYIKPKINKK